MTTGDEEGENLVDNLFRDVDDQFKDLEREYQVAREDMGAADAGRRDSTSDSALEASTERFDLMSQVATLKAEISRQADELDERDRLLGELGDKIAGFQADIGERDDMLDELHTARQQVLDEKREQARLSALLDARAAERGELTDVAHRLQNERDHAQELLTTALARFDESESKLVQMDDKLRHIEAARDTAAHEHDARAHELIESRAEMSKVADQLNELTKDAAAADKRAEKSEALAERRANEAGYLNRRIDAMNDKLTSAGELESEATRLRKELALNERRVTELQRLVDTHQSEASAANAAVDAIAERTADYDELVERIEELKEERDQAWEAASGHAPAEAAAEPVPAVAAKDEVAALADRARELGARRASEAELAAQAAEHAAAEAAEAVAAEAVEPLEAVEVEPKSDTVEPKSDTVEPKSDTVEPKSDAGADAPTSVIEDDEEQDDNLVDLEPDDVEAIEWDLARLADDAHQDEPVEEPAAEPAPAPERVQVPRIRQVQDTADDTADDAAPSAVPVDDIFVEMQPQLNDTAEIPVISASSRPPVQDEPESQLPEPTPAVAPATELASDGIPQVRLEPASTTPSIMSSGSIAMRKRTILPADLVPNTPEAVAYLLSQPAVIAIVDARSTCGRTGIRPSELFERMAQLRDHFDVPIEVVVTPVSTPVGGAPDLPAIGVHYVTGADTVADRIRALCMGFPADQPLVVIAGDDHVRRAAIGEEANVVEPAAVLNIADH